MSFIIRIGILTLSTCLWGHGKDKLGPHGGYIDMPGPFHTEVVPSKEAIQIYLLDIGFKNPTVKNSKASAVLIQEGKERVLSCTSKSKAIFFECHLPKDVQLDKGQLIIRSNRMGAFDGVSTYPLPFLLLKMNN